MTPRPRRIVSLSPSATEILCALGLGRSLVGTDKWSDYPRSVRLLPKVGGIEADLEKVRALAPDLVVACTSVPGMERTVAALAGFGVPVVVAEPTNLPSVLESVRALGAATGRERRAERVILGFQARSERIVTATRGAAERPRVYWEWWPKPLSAAAGGSWMTALIEMAGGTNVFADVPTASVRPDDALVRERDPEVIVLCWCGAKRAPRAERVLARDGWSGITGVARRAVFAVPEGLFARPGPRLVAGLERLADLLHPELRLAAGASTDD